MNPLLGKKIIIIGSSGSGKTTLALKLSKIMNLPVIHLDKEFWNAGWVETPREQWIEKQNLLLMSNQWIADGNYGGTLEVRLEKAETVILLDYSRYICLFRAIKRWLTNFGRTRADMAEGCIEKIDWEFLKFIWRFPIDSRSNIMNKLKNHKNINTIIFKSPKDTQLFINSFSNK